MKLSLIIPAYNEEKRLPAFLETVVAYAKNYPDEIFEVIIIDDGSTDQTARVAQSSTGRLPRGQMRQHEQNKGKGAAVHTGMKSAEGDYIVFMDADGATAIEELPKMVQALSQADIGIGNRSMPGSKTDRHSLLRTFSGWANRVYMGLFGLGRIDTMCGFKGYRREVAHDLFKDLMEQRWLFDTEIAYKALRRGYKIKNFPIRWVSKDGSKLDMKTLIRSGLQIWPLIRRIKRQEGKNEIAKSSIRN